MATYYRWRRSTVKYVENGPAGYAPSYVVGTVPSSVDQINYTTIYAYTEPAHQFNEKTGEYSFQYANTYYVQRGKQVSLGTESALILEDFKQQLIYYAGETYGIDLAFDSTGQIRVYTDSSSPYRIYVKNARAEVDTSQGYVYSTSSSAYPNGGVKGDYYYDQRTTVTSPTAASGLTYPATITTPSVSISWTAATSNVPNYTVNLYEVSYSTNNGDSWTVAGTTAETSYSFSVPAGTTSIMFRVRARDSNNQWGAYKTGTDSQVLLAPTLTVPQMVMQGQSTTISWSAVEGADSYTLERKSSADADWMQVYSGANLSYTETVGTWTSLQYRVQAVFDETPGDWATSDSIQIVAASALVISGTDGDLGALTSDVQYSVSSDQTGNTISVSVEVNGGEYAEFTATSGQTYSVGVLDLPTGTGNITITATTTVSSSPVTVTRSWTYSKTATSFPSAGNVGRLTQEGAVVWPETLAEAVRAGTPWGGNLSTALELLKKAALYNRAQTPKYNEVTVNMANVTEGQIVSIPRGGVMVPHYVAKLEYESGLNGAGRRLLVPVECYDKRAWDSGGVNAYATSDIDTWMNSTYKALFPSEIQTAMGTTGVYYTPGNGNTTVSTLERSIFALSVTELGESNDLYANVEGSALPIASTLQIAYQGGSATAQWTRSPHTGYTDCAWRLNSNGDIGSRSCTSTLGSRPAFTLPSTFTATYLVDTQGTIHDQQEYTEAGDWLDVWGNTIPAVRIETGSYVGTGTYGESNPNTLTFPFEPKIVIIAKRNSTNFYGVVVFVNPSGCAMSWNAAGESKRLVALWSGNGLSWYPESSSDFAIVQLNESGTTYDYVALG